MTVMVVEVYDALIDAGATEDKARKAASAVAGYDTRLSVLTWMVATNIVITLGVLGRLLST